MGSLFKFRLNLLQLAILYIVFRFIEKSVERSKLSEEKDVILPPYKKREIHIIHFMHSESTILQNKEGFTPLFFVVTTLIVI